MTEISIILKLNNPASINPDVFLDFYTDTDTSQAQRHRRTLLHKQLSEVISKYITQQPIMGTYTVTHINKLDVASLLPANQERLSLSDLSDALSFDDSFFDQALFDQTPYETQLANIYVYFKTNYPHIENLQHVDLTAFFDKQPTSDPIETEPQSDPGIDSEPLLKPLTLDEYAEDFANVLKTPVFYKRYASRTILKTTFEALVPSNLTSDTNGSAETSEIDTATILAIGDCVLNRKITGQALRNFYSDLQQRFINRTPQLFAALSQKADENLTFNIQQGNLTRDEFVKFTLLLLPRRLTILPASRNYENRFAKLIRSAITDAEQLNESIADHTFQPFISTYASSRYLTPRNQTDAIVTLYY